MAQHAEALGVDPERIYLGGESVGAAHAAAGLVTRFGAHRQVRPAGLLLTSCVYNVELDSRCRAQFGIATPDPRNDAYFGTDARAMSTVRLIDAAPLPVWPSYAELDPVQMQAGELFAALVTQHGFAPQITAIAGHN